MRHFVRAIAITVVALIATGCATTQPTYDYTALEASKPRSILVIPPINNSVAVNAPYIYLSTISAPLAEKGYYVFPVAVIERFLTSNGLQSPADMHNISLEKIREHINPDAVLYVTIQDWGQKYHVVDSTTVVNTELKLVDAKTGHILWTAKAALAQGANNGGGGLAGMLISAVVNQVIGSVSDRTPQVSAIANNIAINHRNLGLLPGPYAAKN